MTGRWNKEQRHIQNAKQDFKFDWVSCSVCGKPPQKVWELTPYCPWCGVKMDGDSK